MQITLQDLSVAAQLIDLATKRGAYNASEASAVGEVFNKIATFLKETEEAAKKEADGEEGATEGATEGASVDAPETVQ